MMTKPLKIDFSTKYGKITYNNVNKFNMIIVPKKYKIT